jgi:hypothetical protein
MEPQTPGVSWSVIAETLGGILVSILGWLGALAFKDVRFLNRNAVLREEIRKEFESLRVENTEMHTERMELTKLNHEENRIRLARIEAIFERTEDSNRASREWINNRFQELVERVEQINTESIMRDANKENRK